MKIQINYIIVACVFLLLGAIMLKYSDNKSSDVVYVSIQPDVQSEQKPVEPKDEYELDVINSYTDAFEIARKHNKKVFLYFTVYGCSECRRIERNMYKDKDNYVYTKFNINYDQNAFDICNKYGAMEYAPMYVIIDPVNGQILKKGYEIQHHSLIWFNGRPSCSIY